jgi:hypothetical protein
MKGAFFKLVISLLLFTSIVAFGVTLAGLGTAGFLLSRNTLENDGQWMSLKEKVNIPRQSRGLYVVSRSKRLCGDANAAP